MLKDPLDHVAMTTRESVGCESDFQQCVGPHLEPVNIQDERKREKKPVI